MAQEVSTWEEATPYPGRRRRRFNQLRTVVLLIGLAAVFAGVGIIVPPIIGALIRGHGDQSALQSWNNGGSNALRGAAAADTSRSACGSSNPRDDALVTFGAPAEDHYAGVAGDGTWDLLNSRSMVHYHGTPDPGRRGNVIIAFHREPDYQNIDQLQAGDSVTIQDRSCTTYVYKITQRWDLAPAQVTQLVPTSGHDLTLVTCDPWWQDYNRLVWRAELVSSPAASDGAAPAAGATPGKPSVVSSPPR